MIDIDVLQKKANKHRKTILQMIYEGSSGHPGGSLSLIDMLTAIYELDVDLTCPVRSNVILSKGHAVPAQYAILYDQGIIRKEELKTYRKINSRLQGHPYRKDIPQVDTTTGLLGQGLSIGVGKAIIKQKRNENNKVYVILGDGELLEGQIWEAMLQAAHYKLDHLVVIVDYNKLSSSGDVNQVIQLESLDDKFNAFGFDVQHINGHQMQEIVDALTQIRYEQQPHVIIMDTIKGKGVSFMENDPSWHSKNMSLFDYEKAMEEINSLEV